ncbi:hypothetical protein BGX26_000859 [Mortierella sp. AD094]|nr:hypothetical protein BGX26_000859 [Mortierella sp. AD094]
MAPTVQAPLFSFISDQSLALLLPIAVYWAYSLIFHWVSQQGIPWFEKYRIHRKEEDTRNKVALPDVIKAVVIQQLLQTALGFIVVLTDDSEVVFNDELSLARYQTRISSFLSLLYLQAVVPNPVVKAIAHICYFYLESFIRFSFAMAILDTWQYFLHRLFHNVPYLYKHFHSRHHRLIVTYPFGALYNHPFEGFMMDSVGASLAFLASGMGNRGALAFFSFSTLKTLDDHCGHDIHHQPFGFKKNFSQPFGTIWDHILSTHMSREEANEIIRKKDELKAAQAFNIKSVTSPSKTDEISNSEHSKDCDLYSSGNNSGNDSQEEDQDRQNKLLMDQQNVDSLVGVRERLSTRARLDNGFVSGKGQGKAL